MYKKSKQKKQLLIENIFCIESFYVKKKKEKERTEKNQRKTLFCSSSLFQFVQIPFQTIEKRYSMSVRLFRICFMFFDVVMTQLCAMLLCNAQHTRVYVSSVCFVCFTCITMRSRRQMDAKLTTQQHFRHSISCVSTNKYSNEFNKMFGGMNASGSA